MSESKEKRRAEIRIDCQQYPPESYGEMLVSCAAELNEDWVEVLIELGADVNTRSNNDGSTALTAACANKESLHLAKILTNHGCNVNEYDNFGSSPLHWASYYNNLQTTEFLISKKANLNHQDKKGKTALLKAMGLAEHDRLDKEIIKCLLGHGADPNIADDWSRTPLHLASAFSDLEIIQLLLDCGADIEAQGGPSNLSVLMEAAAESRPEVVKFLLNNGANPNGEATKPLGFTALIMACNSKESAPEVVDILLNAGSDISSKAKNGRTVLFYAIAKKRTDIIELLIRHGADTSVTDEEGISVREFAKKQKMPAIIDLLE